MQRSRWYSRPFLVLLALGLAFAGGTVVSADDLGDAKAQLAALKAEQEQLLKDFAQSEIELQVAEENLSQVQAALPGQQAKLAELELGLAQFALVRYQDLGFSEATIFITAPDAGAAVDRLIMTQYLETRMTDLTQSYRLELTALEESLAAEQTHVAQAQAERERLEQLSRESDTKLRLASRLVDKLTGANYGLSASSTGLDGLVPSAAAIVQAVSENFPEIRTIGGKRAGTGEHGQGRAVDIMIPNWQSNTGLGYEIAQYFQARAAAYNIYYIIWNQTCWFVGQPLDRWQPMEDRGSDTANHKDHVHISVN